MEFLLPALKFNETEVVRRHLNASVVYFLDTVNVLSDYYLPLLVACGTASNIIAAALFSRRRLITQSYAQYCIGLVVSDSFFLLTIFFFWLKYLINPTTVLSGFWCQAIIFSTSICAFLSVWMNVAISFDRFLHVFLPFRRSVFGALNRARLVILGLLCFAVPLFLNLSILAGEIETEFGHVCMRLDVYDETLGILVFVDGAINFFVPYFGIAILNLLTGVQIIRNQIIARQQDGSRECLDADTSDIHQNDNESIRAQYRSTDDTSQTVATIVCGLLFLALTFPAQVLQLSITLSDSHRLMCSTDVTTYAVQQTMLLLWYTRLGTTFLAHFFCNRSFRRQAFAAVCGRKYDATNQPEETLLENLTEDRTDCRAGLITTEL